jgi:Na+/H+-dicarboxylate symporter
LDAHNLGPLDRSAYEILRTAGDGQLFKLLTLLMSPLQKLLRLPLYGQIVIALILAVLLGLGLGNVKDSIGTDNLNHLAQPATLIIRALSTLATPLIFLSIINTLMTAEIPDGAAKKLGWLLSTNTLTAIGIGLFVANILQPGRSSNLPQPNPKDVKEIAAKSQGFDPWQLLDSAIPDSIVKPFADKTSVISLVILGLAFGVALRLYKQRQIAEAKTDYRPLEQVIGVLFAIVIRILHWIINLVPLAVLGIVAKTIAIKGFEPFKALFAFSIAVLLALLLQAAFYLLRLRFGSWVTPGHLLQKGKDPLVAAFSTASSTATMPITYETLIEKVGLRRSSASLGALVGSNFNNDGTALYEAMAALFIAQALNIQLNLTQQLMVMLTSVFASVGAAGIPEAGLVTMSLVFNSVGLPTQYIAILLTVDWFLDRARTAINVMGDMTVSSLVDGRSQSVAAEDEEIS